MNLASSQEDGDALTGEDKPNRVNPDETKLIVVQENPEAKEASLMVEEASRYGWRLFQVGGKLVLPEGLKPAGALLRTPDSRVGQQVQKLKIPFVRVGNFPYFYGSGTPSVFVDHPECGKVGAKFFADRGFKSLLFIGNDPWGESKELFDKYERTADNLGCNCYLYRRLSSKFAPEGVDLEVWRRERDKEMVEWVKTLPKPLGLLAYNDSFAASLSLLFYSYGVRIPDDVAILGVGNNEFRCETSLVPMSSIEHSWKDMWRVSFKMLNDKINGIDIGTDTTYIPPKGVVERASTDILPVEDPVVTLALKYIWENFFKDVSTHHLVEVTKVSRSTLERRFKSSLGRTINDELRRKRIEVAERLLCNTDQSISEISEQVGFNSRNHFYKVFDSIHGCTPANYRRSVQSKN